ncbi:hypothetical protein ACPPVO_15650 [Dactylosporangium sp. McL0621]|uniref:hypothetical protein n=1 Tax=Dactylosporangium sp. McL0621 TaxID=3415678 RepID=UPI003CF8423A
MGSALGIAALGALLAGAGVRVALLAGAGVRVALLAGAAGYPVAMASALPIRLPARPLS